MSKAVYVTIVIAAATLQTGSLRAQNQKQLPALEADIETTFTTPQGQFSTPGHFYRSHDGKVREDSPVGSMIMDVKKGTVTLLNRHTKEAKVIAVADQPRPAAPETGKGLDPFEEGVVEGHAVTKARKHNADSTAEIWTAKDLGVSMLSKVEAPSFAMTKVLRNVSLREPDPEVFRIPKDYTVTHETGLPARPNRAGGQAHSPFGQVLPPTRH